MSGTDKRRGGVSVRCSEETKDLLRSYAQGKGKDIGMNNVLDLVIPKVIEFDLYDPDWADNVKKAQERAQIYAELDGQCGALAFSEDEKEADLYRCVWYQEEKPPFIRVLGRTLSKQRAACGSCDRTKKIVKGLIARDERIIELETSLKAKASEVFKAPVCNVGARLTAHGTQFSGCRRHPREPVSIDGFCRVYRAGLPCHSFAEVVIAVGDGKSKTELNK